MGSQGDPALTGGQVAHSRWATFRGDGEIKKQRGDKKASGSGTGSAAGFKIEVLTTKVYLLDST